MSKPKDIDQTWKIKRLKIFLLICQREISGKAYHYFQKSLATKNRLMKAHKSVFDMTEIIAIDFYHLFLRAEQHFLNQDGLKWYSIIDVNLHDRNLAVICFEKASCWDSETNQQNFVLKVR